MTKTQKIRQGKVGSAVRQEVGKVSESGLGSARRVPRTPRECGLTDEEVERNRRLYGNNTLAKAKKPSFMRHFISNLGDPIIKILLCALAVNLVFMFQGSDWIESVGIAVSIFLATFISTLSEYGSETAFDKLSEQCASADCKVRRNGRISVIPSSELVCGDIILLSAGEKIPADGILTYGSLAVDQSALTGETREVNKYVSASTSAEPSAPSSMCGGCVIVSGEGEMTVTGVGDSTSLGRISLEIQEDKRQSPLKLRLARLAKQISTLGYIAAILIAVVYLINAFIFDSGFSRDVILLKLCDRRYLFSTLLSAFTLGLTVVVMAVPEGLPMMIAVVLSSNIKRMVKDQVLVRKPVGIEAAGSMNILFTDKTGTLTCGKMRVDELILGDLSHFSSPFSLPSSGRALTDYIANARCNNSSVISEGRAVGGNATDRAVLGSTISQKYKESSYKVLKKLPFDSKRKFSAATVLITSSSVKATYIKGAPEMILPYVTECECGNGKSAPFGLFKKAFASKLSELTENGARVILTAVMIDPYFDVDDIRQGKMGRLRLTAALVLRDPLRRQAPEAVKKLQDAGIQVVMITGDSKSTASEIAAKCGIIKGEQNICLTSEELSKLSDEKLSELLPRLALVARALPSDKSRLVKIAEGLGLVVGMTGDGINDAPALRRADVGFAMGDGTQVAKDAGDIIILDNDLSSIVKAVLYGRTIFKSIRKFIVLQLTMNLCAVGVCMIGPFIGIDQPVTVVQMLWINIIMDTLGGLAFAGEPALDIYMKEPPKRRDEPILNRYMINEILLLGGGTVALLIAFLVSPDITVHFRAAKDDIYVLTAFFALFIFSGVFNCFNARTDRLNPFNGLGSNPTFIVIMTAVCTIQLLFVYIGGSALRTAPLTLGELKYTMLLALSVFPIEWARKIIWKLRYKSRGY